MTPSPKPPGTRGGLPLLSGICPGSRGRPATPSPPAAITRKGRAAFSPPGADAGEARKEGASEFPSPVCDLAGKQGFSKWFSLEPFFPLGGKEGTSFF